MRAPAIARSVGQRSGAGCLRRQLLRTFAPPATTPAAAAAPAAATLAADVAAARLGVAKACAHRDRRVRRSAACWSQRAELCGAGAEKEEEVAEESANKRAHGRVGVREKAGAPALRSEGPSPRPDIVLRLPRSGGEETSGQAKKMNDCQPKTNTKAFFCVLRGEALEAALHFASKRQNGTKKKPLQNT